MEPKYGFFWLSNDNNDRLSCSNSFSTRYKYTNSVNKCGQKSQNDSHDSFPHNKDQRHCMTHESCGKCLATELHSICGWCTDPGYDMRRPRCLSLADLNSTACKSVYQTKERPWLIENLTTQDFGASDAVQIQPQRVRIGLKKCK